MTEIITRLDTTNLDYSTRINENKQEIIPEIDFFPDDPINTSTGKNPFKDLVIFFLKELKFEIFIENLSRSSLLMTDMYIMNYKYEQSLNRSFLSEMCYPDGDLVIRSTIWNFIQELSYFNKEEYDLIKNENVIKMKKMLQKDPKYAKKKNNHLAEH